MLVLGVVGLLALGGAALALRLEPSSSVGTLVSSDSETGEATDRFKRQFGADAVFVLVKGNLRRAVLTSDPGRLVNLEGGLPGNVPEKGLRGLPRQCREIKRLKPAKVVFGPGTFI